MPKRRQSQVAAVFLSMLLVFSPGCMTVTGWFNDGGFEPMSGTRFYLDTMKDPIGLTLVFFLWWDVPLSLAMDLVALPITVPAYFINEVFKDDDK